MKETQEVMKETIQNCFTEMMVVVNGRLDRMQSEINERFVGIERRLDGIDERLNRMEKRMDGMEKRMDGIDERLDGIDERLDGIDERLDGMEKRMDEMEKRLDGIDERLNRMDKRLDGIDERLDKMDEHLKEHDEQFYLLDRKLSGLALHVENETDKYIQILAENHLTLTGKLNEGIEAHNGNKLYAIKVNYLIDRVDRLYDDVEGIKRQIKIRRPGKRSMKVLS